jgi:periplasmic protein TonB
VTTSLRCLGCRLAAVVISGGVHLAVAAILLWAEVGGAPADDPAAGEVAVTLAMFVDPGPPDGVPAEPVEVPPAPETDPVPDAEQVAEAPPEPQAEEEVTPDPIPERAQEPPPAPEAIAEVAAEPEPEVVARPPKPKPKPKPVRRSKPIAAPKVVKARPSPARAQPVAAHTPGPAAAAVASPVAPEGETGSAKGSASVAAIEGDYLRGLQRAIARNRFYPPGARRQDVTGVATVAFTIQSDGRLGDIRLAKSSGSEALDQAALETLRRLGSYRPIPAGTGRARWPVRVPIVFDLR